VSRERDRSSPDRVAAGAWALVPYAVFLLLVGISWGRWIEPYVDSGRELMTPLRLARGEKLYRDVRFYHGPLAPYLAAGLEKLHSRSLGSRIALAGMIALLHLEALRRLARRWMGPARTALAVSGIVAAVFFAKPGGQLFPFSLDTAIAVAAIAWTLHLAAGKASGPREIAAAICVLAALLSRPEMGLLVAAALILDGSGGLRFAKLALIPLLAAGLIYAVLSLGVPLRTLRQEGWLALLGPPEAFRNVYAAYAGFDRPSLRVAELGLAAVLLALIALLVALGALASGRTKKRLAASGVEAGCILLLAAGAWFRFRPLPSLAPTLDLLPALIRVVPPLVLAAAVWRLATRLSRGSARHASSGAVPDSLLFVSAVFASRVLLTAGYSGPYGSFLLPLPLLIFTLGLFTVADRTALRLGSAFARLWTGALAVFLLCRIATLWDQNRGSGWSRVETPAGSLSLVEPVARTTQETLLSLSNHLPLGATLVGFPEGGFFNYVLDLRNPLPQEQFFPGHLDNRAEGDVIQRLREHPPDAVLLCNVLAVGHGSLAFGRDYLTALGRTVDDGFLPVASFGPGAGPSARIGDPQFFVTIRVPRPVLPAPAQ
jgi:hypothetical protein